MNVYQLDFLKRLKKPGTRSLLLLTNYQNNIQASTMQLRILALLRTMIFRNISVRGVGLL